MNNTLKKSNFIFLLIFSYLAGSAQVITGVWNGTLHIQTKDFPIVQHFLLNR